MSSTEDIFQQSMQKIKEQKAQDAAKKNRTYTDYEYEEIKYIGLDDYVDKVLRIVGKPADKRTEVWDPKFLLFSQILSDNPERMIHVYFPYEIDEDKSIPVPDESWILMRLYNKIRSSEWDKSLPNKDPNKTGNWLYYYEDKESFSRVMNNKKKEWKYGDSFYPSRKVVMNVIDRHDSWCIENRHTKLLSSKVNEGEVNDKGITRVYAAPGVPYSVYKGVFENVVEYVKHWDIDIVIKKRPDEKDYIIRDITEKKISDEAKKIGTDDRLTDVEKAYEKYNIDKLYKATSYQKLKKHLKKLFKQCDLDTGSNYEEELNELAEIEKKEYEEQQKKSNVSITKEKEIDTLDDDIPYGEPEKEPVQDQPKKRRRNLEIVHVESDKQDPLLKVFPHFRGLPEEEKQIIRDTVIIEDGKVSWKKDATPFPCEDRKCVYPGTEARTLMPSTIFNCAVCGMEFDSEEKN